MARSRRRETGRYSVLDRSYPSAGAALSYAQNVAVRQWTEPNAVFVKDLGGESIYKAVRDEEGVVHTYTLKEV